MSDVAAHPEVRAHWPVISQALEASGLSRNCGTWRPSAATCCSARGAWLFPRHRFQLRVTSASRHPAVPPLPARTACWRSWAAAITASRPMHRILLVALTALDAVLELRRCRRCAAARAHHRVLSPPPGQYAAYRRRCSERGRNDHCGHGPGKCVAARNSHYLKLRDRASFEFALVSAAVALEIRDGTVHDVRVAAGGVGTRPWRLAGSGVGAARQTRTMRRCTRCAPHGRGSGRASGNAEWLQAKILLRRAA